MKDLVEAALEHASEIEERDTTTNEFGPPRFCDLGYGTCGCSRVSTGLVDRNYTYDPPHPLETYVETRCLEAGPAASESGAEQTDDRDALRNVVTGADVCLLTADGDEPGIDSYGSL